MNSLKFFIKKTISILRKIGFGRVPGALQLYNVLYIVLAKYILRSTVVDFDGQKIKLNPYDLGVSRRLLLWGNIRHDEVDSFIRGYLKPGMVVADIGANIGYYTLLAAKRVKPNGAVYAFEPDPRCIPLLRENVSLNRHMNVTVVEKGVSNRKGKTDLFIDKEYYALTSMAQKNIINLENKTTIDVVDLDTYFFEEVGNPKVHLIKMNIQGAEGLVIDGAEKILSQNKIALILEFWIEGLEQLGTNPKELLMKLRKLGYNWRAFGEAPNKGNLEIDETVKLARDLIKNKISALKLLFVN